MIRRSTWEADLNAYLREVRDRPFEWGVHDCAMFAAGAVLSMTGVDPIPEFRGEYDSAVGSARALIRLGYADLEAAMDAKFAETPIAMAQRGDLVWHDMSVGVCMGGHGLFVGEEDSGEGLIRIPRSDWMKAWRVG